MPSSFWVKSFSTHSIFSRQQKRGRAFYSVHYMLLLNGVIEANIFKWWKLLYEHAEADGVQG